MAPEPIPAIASPRATVWLLKFAPDIFSRCKSFFAPWDADGIYANRLYNGAVR
jgi:hypothetical protein